MFHAKPLQRLLEARINEADGDFAQKQLTGRNTWIMELWSTLGLLNRNVAKDGSVSFAESVDDLGRPAIAPNSAKATEFSLRHLAEAIFGDSFDRHFNPYEGGDRMALLEAGPGIDPTAFLNINTFSLATSGLVEAQVLERFVNPGFIGDQLVTVRPTRLNGEKMIGITGIGNKAQTRVPGEPHPRAGFGEQYIETPQLDEKALAVEVQQESVFYDLTGQVLDVAGSVGEELGYLREITIIDLVEGVTNPYSRNGTASDTYQATTPWVNEQTNDMADHTDIQNSKSLFRLMRDPDTLKEILVIPTQILHHSDREDDFFRVFNTTELREVTNTDTTTITTGAPSTSVNKPTLLSSPIVDTRREATDGLNLSNANSLIRWLHGDFKKAFMWMEAWPIRVRQASATEYGMLDRGIIAAYFANYRGIGAVREPRYTVANIN